MQSKTHNKKHEKLFIRKRKKSELKERVKDIVIEIEAVSWVGLKGKARKLESRET
jgi:hypothetical protein